MMDLMQLVALVAPLIPFGVIIYKIGRQNGVVENNTKDIAKIEDEYKKMDKKFFSCIRELEEKIDDRLEKLNSRQDEFVTQVGNISNVMVRIETKLDEVMKYIEKNRD